MDQTFDSRLLPAFVSFPVDGRRDGSARVMFTGKSDHTPGPAGRPPLASFARRRMVGDAKLGNGAGPVRIMLAALAVLSVGFDVYRHLAEVFRTHPDVSWLSGHILWMVLIAIQTALVIRILGSVIARSDAPERWQLEIYPEGVIYRFPGGQVQAPWQAFGGIGRVASVRVGGDGILLAHGERFPAFRILRGIPLSFFDQEWRNGDIWRWVAYYAPQLLHRPWDSMAA